MSTFDYDPFFNTGLNTGFSGFPFNQQTFNRPRSSLLSSALPTLAGSTVREDMKWNMDLDVIDGEDSYIVMAELPGVPKENINIVIENNLLTLRINKIQTTDLPASFHYDISEIQYGESVRRIRLPLNVDQDSANTCFKDGMLCVKFQKTSQHAQGRKKLEIQSA